MASQPQETSCVEDIKVPVEVVVGIIVGADCGASVEICILVEVEACVGVNEYKLCVDVETRTKDGMQLIESRKLHLYYTYIYMSPSLRKQVLPVHPVVHIQ